MEPPLGDQRLASTRRGRTSVPDGSESTIARTSPPTAEKVAIGGQVGTVRVSTDRKNQTGERRVQEIHCLPGRLAPDSRLAV